jgi:hypothetical protein
LLWYRNAACDLPGLGSRIDSYLQTAALTRSIMRRMASQRVRAHYRELPEHVAQRVDAALAAIRRWAALTRIERGHATHRDAVAELAAVFGDALAQGAGTHAQDALRELQLSAAKPRWRILFGIDRERGAGLLVLGEALEREFYGESVRWALAAWERFRSGARDEALPARAS